MPLLNEVTQAMIDTALVLPSRGLVWVPANGQIVYRKFVGCYVLNKARDPDTGLETDSYWVDNENMNLNDLVTNCVWLPSPNEIRDLATALTAPSYFQSLCQARICPDQWKCEYSIGLFGFGTTPWESEFYILDKYIIGRCTA
jgi:hypothetical protein